MPSMREREGRAGDDEVRFAALQRQLRAAQSRLDDADALRGSLAERVKKAELQGAIAPIGLLADLTQAERALSVLEDDVLDAECALIIAGAQCPDDEPHGF